LVFATQVKRTSFRTRTDFILNQLERGYPESFREYKSDFKHLLIQSALKDLPKPSS
jgi:hypothetical protein